MLQAVCLGALSCALIAVGSCHGDLTENFLQLMMDRESSELTNTHIRFLALALGLLYLGKQKAVEATMEALKAVSGPLSMFASTLLEICAYAGGSYIVYLEMSVTKCPSFMYCVLYGELVAYHAAKPRSK